jgi:hypothetical protein
MDDRREEGRGGPGGSEPEGFGREMREFALEAHRVLGRPCGPFGELMDLHWRAWDLLHEAPPGLTAEADRWVLETRRAVVARLNGWPAEEFESGAA